MNVINARLLMRRIEEVRGVGVQLRDIAFPDQLQNSLSSSAAPAPPASCSRLFLSLWNRIFGIKDNSNAKWPKGSPTPTPSLLMAPASPSPDLKPGMLETPTIIPCLLYCTL